MMRKAWLAALLACLPLLAAGQDPGALDFELSDGQRFVRLSQLPPRTTLINFWRADCPPCVRELPALAQLAAEGRIRVVTIAVQRVAQTLTAPPQVRQALRPPVVALYAPTDPSGLLARFGNASGVLPFSVLISPQRRLCSTHAGELDSQKLHSLACQEF